MNAWVMIPAFASRSATTSPSGKYVTRSSIDRAGAAAGAAVVSGAA